MSKIRAMHHVKRIRCIDIIGCRNKVKQIESKSYIWLGQELRPDTFKTHVRWLWHSKINKIKQIDDQVSPGSSVN